MTAESIGTWRYRTARLARIHGKFMFKTVFEILGNLDILSARRLVKMILDTRRC